MPRLSKSPTTSMVPRIAVSASSSGSTTPNGTSSRATSRLTKSLRSSPTPTPNQPIEHTQTPPAPSQEPTFICTICWQSQFPPSSPKLLGTSSRIVCRACWKAVLDLSICWVCGECIVRGDEVVSLGWCFWHRACFGCLVCGIGMEVRDFEEEEVRWGAWDDVRTTGMGEGGSGKRKRMIGVELEMVPLCTNCEIETAQAPYAEVVERGLETVSKFDGGLTRDRLDMLSEERKETKRASRSRWKRSRFRGSSGLERELKRFINGSTSRASLEKISKSANRADRLQWSEFAMADDREAQAALIKHAAEMGISENGHVDDEHDHSDNEITDFGQTNEESPPNIYVSVFDPVGESAFKPSKTKPLPKWMSLLPNNVRRERDQQQRASTSNVYPHSHEMARLDGRSTSVDNFCQSENDNEDTPSPSNETTPRVLSRSSTAPTSAPIDIPEISRTAWKGLITISIDPKREHAFGDVNQRESIYMTPPEYASRFPMARQKTPYPSRRHPSVTRSETTSCFSQGLPKGEESCTDSPESWPPSCPDETPSHADYVNLPSDSSSRFVVQSSEYLERYQRKSAATKYDRYVPKEREPVIEKIKRQRLGKRSLGEVAEETAERRNNGEKKIKLEDEEYGLDPRREDLKRELRNLFCEE